MTNDMECPECGGDVHNGRSTQKYGYLSCVECEWFGKVEDGQYTTGGG